MKTYARIDDGRVVEIISPASYGSDVLDQSGNVVHHAGDEIAIEDRFTSEFVSTLIDVTDVTPVPEQGWIYDGSTFAPYVPPAPTASDILARNTAIRDVALAHATAAIAPLQDAVDLDEATDAETALLKLWKQYRVAVNRVDLTIESPVWPTPPSA
ncbi:tail fiber assembly protein [Caballeronia sp. INSB1]|uniref:tail fiber assembly protein n=1 Tax=Caballeronia sp. INSB1 TaxID=2921751 RepID=UPI00203280AF|nr:tail fiber assembly protein [Caballeronia sp. INSB1]